jgi:hypothetical protein
MAENDQTPKKKIVVLGSTLSTAEVASYRWDLVPSAFNIADFDIVMLNFYPFRIPEIGNAIDIDTLPSFQQFARLLFSPASQIIVIGSPFFSLGSNPYLESTWWLPLSPRFLDESGDTIDLKNPEYSTYFDHVSSWHFCLSGWQPIHPNYFSAYMNEAGIPRAHSIKARVYSLAENRYGRPIAFSARFDAFSERGGAVGESGLVTWLPPTNEIDVDSAIELLLRDNLGIVGEKRAPSWLANYVLPAETPIIDKIAELERNLDSLRDDLDRAKKALLEASRYKKLLYETGEEVLEPIVLDALAELGASVEPPSVKGKEDGRIVDPFGRLGTLEIKGRSGPLRIGDVRQSHQWVADRIAYGETESKGILIANLKKDQLPSNRGEVFPSNCVRAAQNFGICLFTTTQLLNALMLHQQDALELSKFWRSIFEASGVCDFPELG